MAASEAAVAAVMETLGCRENRRPFQSGVHHLAVTCVVHHRAAVIFGGEVSGKVAQWTDRGCPVAAAAADAAMDADRASIQAETLREAARDVPLFEFMLVMDEAAEVAPGQIGAWLRARADRIEDQP